MSVRLPPFAIGPDSDESEGAPRTISLARVREALAGRDARVSAAAALDLVAGSDLPGRADLLAQGLRNRGLGPDARRRAAILLASADPATSQAVLLETLSDAEPRVQAAAAKGLGWIADAAAYEPLVALMRTASGTTSAAAEWAARLIAHRQGLAAPELPSLRPGVPVEFTSDRRPVRVRTPDAARLRACLDSIAPRTFRLRFDAASARELHCGRSEWMLLVTADAARAPASVLVRRSIAAAVALFIAEEQRFSIALLALVEPPGRLIVCRSTGDPMFAGELRREGEGVAFVLRACSRPGAFPLAVDGSADPGGLTMREVVAGPVVIAKRRPQPIELQPRR